MEQMVENIDESQPGRWNQLVDKGKQILPPLAKSVGKNFANRGTLGIYGSIHDEVFFREEEKRITAINKKVLQNCEDIRKLSIILVGRGEEMGIDPGSTFNEIIERVGKDKCENSLEYSNEIGDLKKIKKKIDTRCSFKI